jgi:hypothetical protein
MAITLSVDLTDTEQAKLLEIAGVLYPNATPAQVKNWAEKKAKLGLRRLITLELNTHVTNSLEEAWPQEPIPLAPEQP